VTPPRFDRDYLRRQYITRVWRDPGSKPVLDSSRLRLLRQWVPGGTLVDVGLGHGAFARRATRWFEVIGVDLDVDVVRRAVAGTEVAGVSASACDLPIRSESVDVVTCIDVVEHLPEPDRFFAEARRVLRPGGYLHISTPNPASFGVRRKGRASYMYQDATHCSVLEMEQWRSKLDAADFTEVWAGTDGLWDVPYFSWVPRVLQWGLFVGASQLAWAFAPAFRWQHGENFLWLGRRRG
jgi:2-polyprenyl-3-methyl-5-hydroxy-6-metoxy-1,4-benzoquinol methylase